MIQLLKRAEGVLPRALSHHVVFDRSTFDRIFQLRLTDIEQVTVTPKLLRRLKQVAPSARIDVGMISDNCPELLESGGVDITVASIHPMGTGFGQQNLFEDRFVCVTRRDHPRVETASPWSSSKTKCISR